MIYNEDGLLIRMMPHLKSFMTSDVANALFRVSFQDGECLERKDEICRETGNDHYFFSLGNTIIKVDTEFSNVTIYCKTELNAIERKNFSDLLLDVFRYIVLWHHGLLAHGAVVSFANKCIMFSGLSGAGKSTQAELWKSVGAWVMNYDKPALWLSDDHRISVSGTPWSGKEPCYNNVILPLDCIVFVKKAIHNRVRRLSDVEAVAAVFPNYMLFPIDDDTSLQYEETILRLISSIPIYELECTPTLEAVYCLMRELQIDKNLIDRRKYSMKAKQGFILRNIAGEHILIPRGKNALDFNATVVLNDTAAFLWKKLSDSEDVSLDQLVGALLAEFNVTYEQAEVDVKVFVEEMRMAGIIDG